MNCLIDDKSGKKISVKMGSYGIGVSRLVGAAIEAKYKNGVMKWPQPISPDVVIIPSISKNNKENLQKGEKIYQELKNKILTYCWMMLMRICQINLKNMT